MTLSTAVAAGTETAASTTNSTSVCDAVDNFATAGPVGSNKVDRRAPDITVRTPSADRYDLGSAVLADYGCTDAGSGIATCAGPVPTGARIGTSTVVPKQLVVSAGDQVGIATSTSVAY